MLAQSMAPTLNVGDYMVVKKLGYSTYGTFGVDVYSRAVAPQKMERGKVYVFYPPHRKQHFVKRLIGLPGDTIVFDGKTYSVNGEKVLLNTTDDSQVFEEVLANQSYQVKFIKPKGSSHPQNQSYLVPENQYFFMGDNRDNSADSRYWGYVPDANIVGEVVYVFSK